MIADNIHIAIENELVHFNYILKTNLVLTIENHVLGLARSIVIHSIMYTSRNIIRSR